MKSPVAYMGGKSRLVPTLVPLIERTPHDCYCEPFCGAAWVLFGKDRAISKAEVINDADGELARFFRVLQNHYLPFVDLYRHAVVSRQIFEWEKMKRPETLTDLQRAARFYYLQRLAFGGKVGDARNFGYSRHSRPKINLDGIAEELVEFHHRLRGVVIEHEDGLACLRRYDAPETLFFLDPPYCGTEGYAVAFPRERYSELAHLLAALRGKFLLTLNDHPHIRDTFAAFHRKPLKTHYTVNGIGDHSKPVTELLFSNFQT
ncbi:MAG: DNA adenine methylase [Kiritimatiellaeota bacterium]|nr:DNA adenine methylase [Kiritimatiellota bacterium]